MIEKHGDMFTSDAPALGHGVNCAGVMGAGVAKTFKEKYENNYLNYRAACQRKQLKPGQIHVNREKSVYIINMATQNKPGMDATYPRVFEAALMAAYGASNFGVDRIAIPEIGCGIGGLGWKSVKRILETTEFIVNSETNAGFNWEVWHYG